MKKEQPINVVKVKKKKKSSTKRKVFGRNSKSNRIRFERISLSGVTDKVRIGVLVDQTKVSFSTLGGIKVYALGKKKRPVIKRLRGEFDVFMMGSQVTLMERGSKKMITRNPKGFRFVSYNPLNTIEIKGKTYRGNFRVVKKSNKQFHVVNHVSLSDYLRGVLPYEMPSKNVVYLDALKAQAIAARTYAVSHLKQYKDMPFDLYSTVQDQVYGGIKAETFLSDKAVKETIGLLLFHGGTLTKCYYHSTCGGKTANIHEVWRGESKNYLVSQKDVDTSGTPFCKASNYINWKRQWSKANLVKILNKNLKSAKVKKFKPFSKIKEISITDKTTSGRVQSLVVKTDKGTIKVRGDKTRWALRLPENPKKILPSSWFRLSTKGDSIMVKGKGLGHGIGMCQRGAMERSRIGQKFNEILAAYYKGTEILRLD